MEGYNFQTSGDIERAVEILKRALNELGVTPVVTDNQTTNEILQAIKNQLTRVTSALEYASARSAEQITHVNANIMSILYNLKVRPGDSFLPLLSLQNQPIPGFPVNHAALAALTDAEVERILGMLMNGQTGNSEMRRLHLEQYIGAWRPAAHMLKGKSVSRGRRG